MSIVKGTGGYLSFTGSLITDLNYTILLWIKDATRPGGYHLNYRNTATTSISVRSSATQMRHTIAQEFAATGNQDHLVAVDNWFSVAAYPSTATPKVYDGATESAGGGFSGDFTAEVSPEMWIWANGGSEELDVDTQLGAIAIFDRILSNTELDDLINSDQNPLETYADDVVEFWDENTGISKDGSDNLITWTGYNGSVLTPSGVVTVDDTDMSPMDAPPVAMSAALTGTITASTNEGDIVAGGKVIRITLTGDTFKAAGTGPIGTIAETQALIDGLTSDGSE